MGPLRLTHLAALLLMAGCSYEDDPDLRPGSASQTFEIIATSPAPGAVGVARNARLTATFNHPPDAATVAAARVRLYSGLYQILGAARVSLLDRSITFTPTSTMRPNLRYLLHFSSAVRGLNGAPLPRSYILDFTTGEQIRVAEPPPPPAPTGADLQSTWSAHCVRCHAGQAAPLGLRLDGGAAAQQALVDQPASVSSLRRVHTGDHARSYLMLKLLNQGGIGGYPMPPDRPALDRATLGRIARWIDAGARP